MRPRMPTDAELQQQAAAVRADENSSHVMFASRVFPWLFIAGSGAGLVALAIQEAVATVPVYQWPLTLFFLAFGVWMRVSGFRYTPERFMWTTILGTTALSVGVVVDGDVSSPKLLFYLWINIGSFYLLSLDRAVLVNVLISLSLLAGLLTTRGTVGDVLTWWGLVTATLIAVGSVVSAGKLRSSRLIVQLAAAARTDPLTGVLNRRAMHERFEAELARAERHVRDISVLLLDADHFKQINDVHGHHLGDDVLVEIANILGGSQRQTDIVARFGGEEFAVVLPEVGLAAAQRVAERFRVLVEERFVDCPADVTISLGVASWPHHGTTVDELLRSADQALYASKAFGRNRVTVFDARLAEAVIEAEAALHDAAADSSPVLMALLESLEKADAYTGEHSRCVAGYAGAIAQELGLDPRHADRVRLAGFVHDIGKLAVPDAVLNKPGKLDDAEWEQIKMHPVTGATMLEDVRFSDVRLWVLRHHERPDGRGYPDGLAGEQIPLEARILAVADAFDAMTSHRSYSTAMSEDEARAELTNNVGSQFDGRVVSALLRVLDSQRLHRDALINEHPGQQAA